MNSEYCVSIREHYVRQWLGKVDAMKFLKGPIDELPPAFEVLQFAPWNNRTTWTVATKCMSQPRDETRIELHMFSYELREELIELLVAAAHFHRTGSGLHIGDTVNFGRPWLPDSVCDHGLISLPYLDGPKLELMSFADRVTHFLWLIPVTQAEVRFARESGLEALEARFELTNFDYADPLRPSVV